MIRLSQIISLFILAPLFFPVFAFCPFRLPYLYCFICPVRCAWYRIRGLVLLIALGLNFKNDFYCAHICPFGTIQLFLSKISPQRLSLPKFLCSFKYIGLGIIVLVIATTKMPQFIFVTRMRHLFLGVFLLSIIASIFSYQFFCHNICPIRALNIILYKIKPK